MATEKRAPSVEEAIEAALAELGITEQEAEIEVVQEPRSGFLGVGAQEAVVRARPRLDSGPAPESDTESDSESEEEADDWDGGLEEEGDAAADVLEELLGRMGLGAIAEPAIEDGRLYIDVQGEGDEDVSLLIGRHGQTLDAIQELTRLITSRRIDARVRALVDVEGYRRRRGERVERVAEQAAQQALRSKSEVELEPMNSYERKIAHDAVAEIDGVESYSRGEEPRRFVVVRPR